MTDAELLDFIVQMKRKARRSGNARRVSYSQSERERAIRLLQEVENKGGTLADTADMLGMHAGTLSNWLHKATEPGSNWKLEGLDANRLLETVLAEMCGTVLE